MHDLKLVDKSGAFVRLVKGEHVQALVATGKVEHINAGARGEKLRLKSNLKVSDFRKSGSGVKVDIVTGITKAHYSEVLDGHPRTAIKRAIRDDGAGTFELRKWDDDLTFEDLRNGRRSHFADEEEQAGGRYCKCPIEGSNDLPDGAVCLVCGGLVLREAA